MGLYDYQPANFNVTGSLNSSSSNSPLLGSNWGQEVDPSYQATPSYIGGTTKVGGMLGSVGSGSGYDPNNTGGGGGFNFGGMLGGTDAFGNKTAGWGGLALGAVQGISNMYMGMKQFGLAKEQLASGKEQFNKNYAAQRTATNNAINDRNVARAASREGASNPYKSLDLVA